MTTRLVGDTIVAIATAHGRGALGIVRLSGPEAQRIAGELLGRSAPLVPRQATFARLAVGERTGTAVRDHVVATCFPGPASYTGEDVVELSVHGSPVILAAIVSAAVDAGARQARAGEFSLRAFLHGRLDLIQAEAVADLIESATPLQARTAYDQLEGTLTSRVAAIEQQLFDLAASLEASLDFPEEGYQFIEPQAAVDRLQEAMAAIEQLLADAERGRLVRGGVRVAVVGRPNAGKSSLFNRLIAAERAIVSDVPGTTRDLVVETVELAGLAVTLVDTAGVHETSDPVEREGIARARRTAEAADVTIVVLDRSRPLDAADRALLETTTARPRVVVASKVDLPTAWDQSSLDGTPAVECSARDGRGLAALTTVLLEALGAQALQREPPRLSNARHVRLLEATQISLRRAAASMQEAVAGPQAEEFVLSDLQEAMAALQEVTGRRAPDATLEAIFSRFCIGK